MNFQFMRSNSQLGTNQDVSGITGGPSALDLMHLNTQSETSFLFYDGKKFSLSLDGFLGRESSMSHICEVTGLQSRLERV